MPTFEFSSYSVVINAPEEWDDEKGDDVSANDAWDTLADKIKVFVEKEVAAINDELTVEVEDISA